ncbi:Putative ABC transporter substrate-binding protein YesO [Aquimixticola soesokkakensis]|uniref:Putative ABC transporter substrate-binding protein YesO n=1 Tax=Aquimixticola soesokkakensis TaxID=1519096 RepID=A0A1Y5RRQ2_9RHOB|nr:ABC transporter substrate-binding protein [Aquimixticola soesokkakensis]SLN23525.1 Putative ABC transporter substrate-binding protein YesO [Aquimixticola soesokkakensis]
MKNLIKSTLAFALATSALTGAATAADLRMSWWGGDSRHIATQEALKLCGEKYGHTVAPEFTGFSGYLEKLTTQMAGGTEPDIMQVNWPWLPLFSQDGEGFYDLNSLSETIDLSQWSAEELAATDIKGKLNGLSISTTGRVFFFNTTTMEDAGLPLPTTWEEFFATAAALREKMGEDHYLYNAGLDGARLLATLYMTQKTGQDLVDPDTNRVAWSVEDLTKAIDFYGEMVEKKAMNSIEQEAAAGNQYLYEKRDWASGKIVGSYEWDTTFFKFSDPLDEGEVLTATKPIKFADAVSDGIYRKASMLFAISKNTKNPQAAAQIINCMLNEPEGIDALKDTRGLPASQTAFDRLTDAGMIAPEILEANAIVMAASGPTLSPFNEHPEVMSIFSDTLEEYAYGMIQSDEAAEVIIDGVNKVLKGFDS